MSPLTNDYIESVWWILKQIWDKGLLYQGSQGRAVLPALRHVALQPRGGAGLQGRHEDPIYVRFPLTAASAARVSGEPKPVSSPSGPPRRGRSPATWRSRCTPDVTYVLVEQTRGERLSWLARDLRRDGARASEADGRAKSSPGSRAASGLHYEPLYRLHGRRTKRRALSSIGARLRHHRGRHRHRAHRARLRRGRHAASAARRPARSCSRWTCEGKFIAEVTPWPGMFVKDADPRHHRRPARHRGLLLPREHVPAHLPVLLALRHAAALLRARRPGTSARRPCKDQLVAANNDDQLVPGAHQERPLRQLAGEQRRLGALPRALLGHAAARLGLRAVRPARSASAASAELRRRSASRVRAGATSTCTGRTSTRSTSPARECGGDDARACPR